MDTRTPTQPGKPTPYWVDGERLVIRSGARLPQYCIKTNKQVSRSEYTKRRIWWTKEVRGRPLFLIVSYLMSRRYCDVTHGLASGQKAWLLAVFVGKLAFMSIGMMGMFTGAALDWNPGVILAFCGLCLVFMGLLPFGNKPLAIVREENGKFW